MHHGEATADKVEEDSTDEDEENRIPAEIIATIRTAQMQASNGNNKQFIGEMVETTVTEPVGSNISLGEKRKRGPEREKRKKCQHKMEQQSRKGTQG